MCAYPLLSERPSCDWLLLLLLRWRLLRLLPLQPSQQRAQGCWVALAFLPNLSWPLLRCRLLQRWILQMHQCLLGEVEQLLLSITVPQRVKSRPLAVRLHLSLIPLVLALPKVAQLAANHSLSLTLPRRALPAVGGLNLLWVQWKLPGGGEEACRAAAGEGLVL
jgi:hypothetical protein